MKEGSICNKCNHRAYCALSDEANNDNATIKGCYLYSERKAKTNADRIREMTDEELAWFISCPEHNDWRTTCLKDDGCLMCRTKWLKQEISDG